ESDADGLDRGNRHQRLCQAAVELAIPVDVAAEARGNAVRDDLEAAAHRVAGVAGAIDLRDHLLLDPAIDAVERGIRRDGPDVGERARKRTRDDRGTDAGHVAGDVHADLAQQLARDGPDRHARGGLTRARALEDVAHILLPVLPETGQVRVPRPRA